MLFLSVFFFRGAVATDREAQRRLGILNRRIVVENPNLRNRIVVKNQAPLNGLRIQAQRSVIGNGPLLNDRRTHAQRIVGGNQSLLTERRAQDLKIASRSGLRISERRKESILNLVR